MAAETTEQFDPYHKWLGIPRDEQPPHHYRLLGISIFENDPNVVENAADRQMSHVRTFQGGKNAKESQRILNQLAAAKVCLLKADRKAEYDQQLRLDEHAKTVAAIPTGAAVPLAAAPLPVPPPANAPPPASPPPAEPAANAGFSPSPRISSSKTVASRRRRKKSNVLPIAIVVLCLAALAVGGVILASQLGGKKNKPSSGDEKSTSGQAKAPKTKTTAARNPLDKSGTIRTPRTKPPETNPPHEKPLPPFKPIPIDAPDDNTVAREKQLREALTKLRAALSDRDVDAAKSHLQTADQLKQTADESAEVEEVRKEVMALAANTTSTLPEFPDSPLTPKPDPDKEKPVRLPIPTSNSDALADARALVRKEFELAGARTSEKKTQLVSELRARADKESDMTLKYALLDQARTLALNENLTEPVLAIADSLAEHFEVDGLRDKQILLTKLASSAEAKLLYEKTTELYEQAISETRYDVAQKLGDTRKRAATRLRDNELLASVNADLRKLAELKRME